MTYRFTFANIEAELAAVLAHGYRAVTCADYIGEKAAGRLDRLFVNRVDIDFSVTKSLRLAEIFDRLGIKGTFFVRLHAPEYNPFSFENYRCLRAIRDAGHEIGYHSEVVDQATIWEEDAAANLRRDLDVLSRMLDIEVRSVASHGGMTGLNNLDFWKDRTPAEFGLLYEAYDREPAFDLFHNSRYVSDSNWTHWKSYHDGVVREGDRRSPAEHAAEGPPVIYSLIHPDTYFDRHFYE